MGIRSSLRLRADRKANKAHMVGLYLFIVLSILLIIYFLYNITVDNIEKESYQKVPATAEYEIERTETISVGRTPVDWDFKIYYPPEIPANDSTSPGQIQHIKELSLEPSPVNDPAEGELIRWERDDFLGTETLKITYSVRSHTVNWDLRGSDCGEVDDITDESVKKLYLGDQWAVDEDGDGEPEDRDRDGKPDAYKIEPTNPVLLSRAEDVVGDESNVYNMIYRIYNFMTKDGNFTYSLGRSGAPASAMDTLASGRGDCDDQSILFISMLRALGIPAWLELGLLYDQTRETWYGHAWTNVYIPMSNDSFEVVSIDVVNEQFLFRTCHHLSDWVDDGVRGRYVGGKWQMSSLADYYFFFSYHWNSRRKPDVSHTEEITTNSYYARGTILYDTETGESRRVEEVPYFDHCAAAVIIILFSAYYYNKRNK